MGAIERIENGPTLAKFRKNGLERWQIQNGVTGLITRRSRVQIQPPLPNSVGSTRSFRPAPRASTTSCAADAFLMHFPRILTYDLRGRFEPNFLDSIRTHLPIDSSNWTPGPAPLRMRAASPENLAPEPPFSRPQPFLPATGSSRPPRKSLRHPCHPSFFMAGQPFPSSAIQRHPPFP